MLDTRLAQRLIIEAINELIMLFNMITDQ